MEQLIFIIKTVSVILFSSVSTFTNFVQSRNTNFVTITRPHEYQNKATYCNQIPPAQDN